MKNAKNDCDKKALEFTDLGQAQQTKIVANLLAVIKKIWRFLLIDFAKKNELQVQWEINQLGHTVWKIYDPTTGKAVRFLSEFEMISWIEDYYAG